MVEKTKRRIDRKIEGIRLKIIQLRTERGYTIEEMASLYGMSKTTYGDLERGKQSLKLEHVLLFSSVLNVPLRSIMES